MQGGARGLAVRAVGLMPITVYVIDPDPDERTWIESALAPSVEAVVVLDDGAALLAHLPAGEGACLIATAEPDETATLELVRELRDSLHQAKGMLGVVRVPRRSRHPISLPSMPRSRAWAQRRREDPVAIAALQTAVRSLRARLE